MPPEQTPPQVRSRDLAFASRTVTGIWEETPAPDNPYLAAGCRCHGYDLLELAAKRSYPEMIFLLFAGELPSRAQAELFGRLMILCANPGPRHPATRAAMYTAVSRTDPALLLPLALSVFSGSHLGAGEVTAAMRFIEANRARGPAALAARLEEENPSPPEGDWHIAPGFGSLHGGIDPMAAKMAGMLGALPGSGPALAFGARFAAALAPLRLGWLVPGLVAAALLDLGFPPRSGAGIFQLLAAPGLLAHGLEMATQPLTAMPFLDEEHYDIAPEARKA